MFRGLLFVRMKAAEQALRDGRLDDAFRMASEVEIAGQARGARLLAKLADAFVVRARDHYRAERFTEALVDLGKADQCGGQESETAELREQVLTVAQEVARQEADRRRRVEQARRCVQGGSIAAGKRLLVSVAGDDAEIEKLQKEMNDREKRSLELITQAASLVKRGRTDEAVDHIERARKLDAGNEEALRLEGQVCDAVAAEARSAFDAGRLKAARSALNRLRSLGRHHNDIAQLTECMDAADQAGAALGAAQFELAQQRVRRLQGLSPKTGWIKQAASQLDRIDAALLSLRGGPLGELAHTPLLNTGRETATAKPADLRETVLLPGRAATGGSELLPKQLLLLIDGGGSYLLHRGDRANVGRAASEDPADIPLYSDLSVAHADIVRVEEDYFLISPNEVEVAGRRTRHQLLKDGDRMVFARRAKITLHVPNRKSPSAALDLSDSTKMPNDVRRIVLMKDTAMIGRGPGCHIACNSAHQTLVLHERNGELWVRPQGRGGSAVARRVELGETIEMDGVSFAVQTWSVRPSGLA